MTANGIISSGRGGAGNMMDKSQSPRLGPQHLQAPTLKSPIYTTGRGGSGNMAKNTDAEATRARQDVEPVEWSQGTTAASSTSSVHAPPQLHGGRGGAGNVFRESLDLSRKSGEGIRPDVIADHSTTATADAHHGTAGMRSDSKAA